MKNTQRKKKRARRKLRRQLWRLNIKIKLRRIKLKEMKIPYGTRVVLRWNDEKHIQSLSVDAKHKSQLGKMLKKYGSRQVVKVRYNRVGFFIINIKRTQD